MPSFTHLKSDTVVYASVEEAQFVTETDVYNYLHKLKADLKVGKGNFPTYIVLCGDQQMYP